jgi:hypothetical protein
MQDWWKFGSRLAACIGLLSIAAATITAAPPAGGATPVLILQRETLWAVHVRSAQLLADRGYESEYTFEFLDEEELRVRALGTAEISSGRIRTILDGEPSEIDIHLKGEPLPLAIHQDGSRLVAAWRTEGRLIPTDLPRAEVERRRDLMIALLSRTRARLGLARFRPSETLRVMLRIAALDAIAFIPVDHEQERYEIRTPRTAAAEERLTTEADGHRWDITWRGGELRVRRFPLLTTRETIVVYRDGAVTGTVGGRMSLDPADAMRIAATGRIYLEAARQRFGTEALMEPLPVVAASP